MTSSLGAAVLFESLGLKMPICHGSLIYITNIIVITITVTIFIITTIFITTTTTTIVINEIAIMLIRPWSYHSPSF